MNIATSRYGANTHVCVAVIVSALVTVSAHAIDEPTTSPPDTVLLNEVLITAIGDDRSIFKTPFSTQQIDSNQLFERSYRTLPQALRDVPGVMVQETAVGQGSPYIRGFTGRQTLLLVDGVRVNNSVFRSGPNQYWNTVDAFSLDRLEVVKGPSSVLYGSDAVGGTVQAFTRDPFGYGEGTNVAGRAVFRFASAERSFQQRAKVSATHDQAFGLLAGFTSKLFGDLDIGGGVQQETSYDEHDADFKGEWWLSDTTRLVALHQRVRQNNVPRTHKTVFAEPFDGTTVGSELQRDLDQQRELTYLQLHAEELDGFVNRFQSGVSYQRQSETRHRQRAGRADDFQGFDVDTFGLFARAESDTPIGVLIYGVEFYHDNVNSFSSSNPIQGPVADDATYDLIGVYIQDEIAIDDRLTVIIGGRLTHAAVDADSVADPATSTRFSLSDDWTSLVGSARAIYELIPDHLNVFGGVSQGFRAPNLSDLTRFDTARTDEFEIPAPGLDPEFYTSFEVGAKGRNENSAVEVTYYYTLIDDMILRVPTGVVDDSGTPLDPSDDLFEVTKDNVGDGYVYGIEFAASQRVCNNFTVFGNLTFTEGEVSTFPTSAPIEADEYLDRTMPLTGQVGVRWDDPDDAFWAEGLVRMAADADRLSTRDAADTSRIPPGGTPGYAVLDLYAGGEINHNTNFRVGIENVFDENYRVHGSGQNMPGISLVFNIEVFIN